MEKELRTLESQKIYRRFIPIGAEEEMKKLDELIADKDLSKADLVLILRCLKLNWNIFPEENPR